MEDCIFCSIKGSESIIYEDDLCMVVPDKYPSRYGHMLVISKEHHADALSSPDGLVAGMFVTAKRFGSKLKEKLNAEGLAISTNVGRQAGQIIFHFHIHVIPFGAKGNKDFEKHREITREEARDFKKLLG